jgi:dihydrodipicolinate synthase/N-acetylneuraminate lyase
MPEEIQQLAAEDVVQSVKWSTAEVSRVHDTKLLCGPSFPVFVGNDLIAFEGLAVKPEWSARVFLSSGPSDTT